MFNIVLSARRTPQSIYAGMHINVTLANKNASVTTHARERKRTLASAHEKFYVPRTEERTEIKRAVHAVRVQYVRMHLQSEEVIQPQHSSRVHTARDSNHRVIMIQWRFDADTKNRIFWDIYGRSVIFSQEQIMFFPRNLNVKWRIRCVALKSEQRCKGGHGLHRVSCVRLKPDLIREY
ncbi:hypothetical protein EV421DRAFT_1741294 [Armillaria borealis]|uniref:Uncharacterized protein n=1 Tax=Armillaria borealis TaxID=47425 RepID=A0AA39MGE8_9AGAR|nr:hypothetical protein EV421DRAFT_1741294 [Armillaria borealis]